MDHRHSRRYPITVQRTCPLGIITFKQLEWSDHTGMVLDISREGVGIELPCPVEPGFVLFKKRLSGYKSGLLLWSRQEGGRYRAGIRFVSLNHEEEQYLQGYDPLTEPHKPRRSADEIINTLIHSFTKSGD